MEWRIVNDHPRSRGWSLCFHAEGSGASSTSHADIRGCPGRPCRATTESAGRHDVAPRAETVAVTVGARPFRHGSGPTTREWSERSSLLHSRCLSAFLGLRLIWTASSGSPSLRPRPDDGREDSLLHRSYQGAPSAALRRPSPQALILAQTPPRGGEPCPGPRSFVHLRSW
jgi:hypothetical protein